MINKEKDVINFITKIKEFDKDDINDEKYYLDINKTINKALSLKKSYSQKNNLKRDELLEKTKENSIINFLNDLQNKSIAQIKNNFLSKIQENSANAQAQIEKSKLQTKEYITKYNNLFEENKKLSQKILEMNNKYRELGFSLKKSQNTISQMQINDENLKQYKLLFDEFLLQYPDIDPIAKMKEIEKNKKSFFNKFNEYNDLQRKFEIDQKEYQQRLKHGQRALSNLEEKLNRIDETNKLKKKENKVIIDELNLEKNTLQKLKEDNNKYRKMLYNLYVKLIEAFKLNKKINIDKKYLTISENDFYPDLLDDLEIWKYIKTMINTINPSINDQSLKETIAYSNMITRIYLKNKNSLRYDPLNTFKELKSIMEEKEQKICKLSDNVKDFEIKLNTMELENKKLNNLFIHFNQERNKNLVNKSVMFNQSPHSKRATSIFNLRNSTTKLSYNPISKNKRASINSRNRPLSSLNKYIYKNNDIKQNSSSHNNNKSIDEQIETDILNRTEKLPKYFKKSGNRQNKFSKISISYNKNYLNNQEMKDFRKIKESKNKDKILKIHNQQQLVKCINEFNQLVNHTNRLFIYKAKLSPKDNKMTNFSKYTRKIVFNKNLTKSKSVELFQNSKKTMIKKEKKDLSKQIVNKLSELIKELENQKYKVKRELDEYGKNRIKKNINFRVNKT